MTLLPTSSSNSVSTTGDAILLGDRSGSVPGFGFNASRLEPGGSEPVLYSGPHLATIAPTGAGKGVSCAIPTLLQYLGACVVIDVKGELYRTTSRRRRELGQTVIRLDPFRLIQPDTDGLNPLDIFQLSGADVDTDTQSLARILSSGKGFSRDPFWELSANGLNSGVLGYIVSCEPAEKRTLGRLIEIVYGEDPVYGLAVVLDTMKAKMPKMAYQEIAAFLQQPDRETRPSTLATAHSFLKNLNSARVLEALSQSTFSLEEFRDGAPLTIYLVIPPDRLVSHSALLTLWIGTLLKAVFGREHQPQHRTLFLVDEAAQLGHFPLLESAITLARSYGVRVWTFWQDVQQLQSSFPVGWRTLLNNSALQVFGVSSRLMARELEAIMDCTAEELLDLAPDEQLLQLGGGVTRSRRLNYLLDPRFQGMFDANPFYGQPDIPSPANPELRRDDEPSGPRL